MSDSRLKEEDKSFFPPFGHLSVPSKMERNSGCWNAHEQEKYIIFLQVFKKELQSRQRRKEQRIFKLMATSIGTRDGIQCRSHHMKQLRTLGRMRNIIENFKKTSHSFTEEGNKFRDFLVSYALENFSRQTDDFKQIRLDTNSRKARNFCPTKSTQIPKEDQNFQAEGAYNFVFTPTIVFFPLNFMFATSPTSIGMNIDNLPKDQE